MNKTLRLFEKERPSSVANSAEEPFREKKERQVTTPEEGYEPLRIEEKEDADDNSTPTGQAQVFKEVETQAPQIEYSQQCETARITIGK